MIHELKCWPEPFHAIVQGQKTFEFRKNDRNFQVGDQLTLREWDPKSGVYTTNYWWVTVTYIIKEGFGIPEGYCIMSIKFKH